MKKLFFLVFVIFMFPINVLGLSDTARSTIVMDMDSGRILYKKNINEQRLIASITKIMTAVITIENIDISKEITVGEEVLKMYGSNIYIELGEKMTIKNLLYGLLLRSGNDAAIVLANNVCSSEDKFVELMNKKAKEIGMENTIFKNSHGLDEETQNYSTAKDMAILSSYANNLEVYKEISKTKKWSIQTDKKSYVWNNRNKLLYTYKYATGGKTGYTPKAGRTLVTTASKDDLNLTIVTLNDSNEYTTHESLYDYAFDKYKKFLIVDKNNFDIDHTFYKGNLYINKSFSYPLSKDEEGKINILVKLDKNNNYKDNDQIGEVIVTLDKDEIFTTGVYVKKENKNESFFDKIKKILSNLFK